MIQLNNSQTTKKVFNNWRKFLIESHYNEPQLDEISTKYVTQVKSWLDQIPPDKLSFNSIFGDKFRIVIPFEGAAIDIENNDSYARLSAFKVNMERFDYKVDLDNGIVSKEEEYVISKGPKQGEKIKKTKQERIGKYLTNLISLAEKHDKMQAFSSTEGYNFDDHIILMKKIKELYPAVNFNPHRNLTQAFEEVLEQYQDYSSFKSGGLSIIISRHPIDVLRMSDFKNIQSCHSEGGEYFNCAINESKGHGLVAYVVKENDLKRVNIEDDEIFTDKDRSISGITPLSRLRLRRIIDIKNKVEYPIPENIVYGNEISGFQHVVSLWTKQHVEKINVQSNPEDLRYTGGKYTDSEPYRLFYNFMKKNGLEQKWDWERERGPSPSMIHSANDKQEALKQLESEINSRFFNIFKNDVFIISGWNPEDEETILSNFIIRIQLQYNGETDGFTNNEVDKFANFFIGPNRSKFINAIRENVSKYFHLEDKILRHTHIVVLDDTIEVQMNGIIDNSIEALKERFKAISNSNVKYFEQSVIGMVGEIISKYNKEKSEMKEYFKSCLKK